MFNPGYNVCCGCSKESIEKILTREGYEEIGCRWMDG